MVTTSQMAGDPAVGRYPRATVGSQQLTECHDVMDTLLAIYARC